jgi:hypothetical protein
LAAARIRGIYSTALAKLLLNQGFTIVQASQALKERFNLEESDESPDLDINDHCDLRGIRVLGKSDVITAFLSLLSSRLEDVIVRKWSLTAGGIYKWVIKEIDEANNARAVVGILNGSEVPKNSRNLLGHHIGSKTPILTGEIKILGKHAIARAVQFLLMWSFQPNQSTY